jgi:hypothetical protein
MNSGGRHVYGPRPIGSLIPGLTRAAFRRRSPATAQVLADWTAIVGPAMAAVTTPRRLSAGTLSIACIGPIAIELQHLAIEVIARINGHLGKPLVKALRFVQTPDLSAPLPPPVPPPDPVDFPAIGAALAELPDGELRGALASLGLAVASSNRRSRLP